MKFIRCGECGDLQALHPAAWRRCHCAASGGQYDHDGRTALVVGKAEVYGVDNRVFTTGRAEAFLISEPCQWVKRFDTVADVAGRPRIATPSESRVVDLMTALEASLAEAKAATPAGTPPEGEA